MKHGYPEHTTPRHEHKILTCCDQIYIMQMDEGYNVRVDEVVKTLRRVILTH